MRKQILHVYAGDYSMKSNGINTVLNALPNYQKKYIDSSVYFVQKKEDYKKLMKFLKNNDSFLTVFHGVYYVEYIKISEIVLKKNLRYYIEPHSSFMKTAQKKGKIKKMLLIRLFLADF